MTIESPKTTVLKTPEEVFAILDEVKHFKTLMPDNTVKFEVVNEGKFLFALQGMPEITLKFKEKHTPKKIVYESADGKVPFTLTLYIDAIENKKSEVQFVFEGEFNPMMTMMIKKPISNFINVLSRNTKKL
jgi:hypothetical protein